MYRKPYAIQIAEVSEYPIDVPTRVAYWAIPQNLLLIPPVKKEKLLVLGFHVFERTSFFLYPARPAPITCLVWYDKYLDKFVEVNVSWGLNTFITVQSVAVNKVILINKLFLVENLVLSLIEWTQT